MRGALPVELFLERTPCLTGSCSEPGAPDEYPELGSMTGLLQKDG